MIFKELCEKRFSFRGFENKPVEQEKLDYIMECARIAPSAANRQPWKIYLIKNEDVKKSLVSAYNREWFAEAPVIVVFTGIEDENWVRNSDKTSYLLCDVTIIADYFILAATEQGLGTCYIAAFDPDKVRQALRLPKNETPLLLSPLGYPKANSTRERSRKEMDQIKVEII